MAKLNNIDIPDEIEFKINRLVEEGEFLSFEEAVAELLSSGITTYQVSGNTSSDPHMPPKDEYMF